MFKILLGTNNYKKGVELSELLLSFGVGVSTLADFACGFEVVEDGKSFIENARKKAIECARFFKTPSIGEDSGLCVEALGGLPGIYSARFAATNNSNATDVENNKLLLEKLSSVPIMKRTAFYTCAAVVVDATGVIIGEAQEYCRGRILFEASGEGGFGYDPLFEIIEYHKTFAALNPAVKKTISHRARTMRKLIPSILKIKNTNLE
ncbi:MAG: non-canonical purine NTP pyrophosphatase [Planctomycetaceae bacterium]|jgi:XTP/dITP diphosphohydrolase|nr:non-canonical purine NTP pyrophosphatase [Planctomycetaceae bacterium]